MAQKVNNLPTMQEIQVRSLGEEDPLEKGMATCSSILAWKILWTEEPGTLQSMGVTRVRHDLVTKPPPLTTPVLLPTFLSLQKSWDIVFSFLLSGTREGPYDFLLLRDWWWVSH